MKWVLIVAVFGGAPVSTGLQFETIDQCLRAEEAMRAEYIRVFNEWIKWATANPQQSSYPKSQDFQMRRLGLKNQGTCVPAP